MESDTLECLVPDNWSANFDVREMLSGFDVAVQYGEG